MKEKFEWKAEIKFEGTADQFNELSATLARFPVELVIPEWVDRPGHLAGCNPFPIDTLIGRDWLEKVAKDMPRFKIKYIQGIDGGIRTPHFHLENEVVFLDRTQFTQYVANVSQELGKRRAEMIEDYIEVMDPINRLVPGR